MNVRISSIYNKFVQINQKRHLSTRMYKRLGQALPKGLIQLASKQRKGALPH